jgi:hypothetical protein
MKSSNSFHQALAGLPPAIAAELEDHLLESAADSQSRGTPVDNAQSLALRQLGDPADIANACTRAVRCPWWCRRGLPIEWRVLVAGWMALGIFFTSRVCVAPEPSSLSIAICVLAGIASVVLGAILLRGRARLRRLAVAASVAITVLGGGLLALSDLRPVITASYALGPSLSFALAAFGLLSAGVLQSRRLRRWAG